MLFQTILTSIFGLAALSISVPSNQDTPPREAFKGVNAPSISEVLSASDIRKDNTNLCGTVRIESPTFEDNILRFTPFNISILTVGHSHIVIENFTDAETEPNNVAARETFSSPQPTLQKRHDYTELQTNITIESLDPLFQGNNRALVLFKSVNAPFVNNATLDITVDGGLGLGTYEVCSFSTATPNTDGSDVPEPLDDSCSNFIISE